MNWIKNNRNNRYLLILMCQALFRYSPYISLFNPYHHPMQLILYSHLIDE